MSFRSLPLLCLALAGCETTSPVSLIGTWDLRLDPDQGWHRHALEISAVDGARVDGRVVIDRGIGPQARVPSPDEITHTVSFEGRWSEPTLRFEVSVGTLHPIIYAEPPKHSTRRSTAPTRPQLPTKRERHRPNLF